jgi:Uma2 family endonuclease
MSEGIQTRRWTRAEYDRLIEIGVFQPGDRVELLGGELIVAEPQSEPHYTAIGLTEEALRAALGAGWVVRTQGPIALDDESEPEPDIAVVPGSPRDYLPSHPSSPVLILEAAESSLALDREIKGTLYARAQIMDYWIVNLVDQVLEVYRDPVATPASPDVWHYASVTTLRGGDVVTPLAAPRSPVPVVDLLP